MYGCEKQDLTVYHFMRRKTDASVIIFAWGTAWIRFSGRPPKDRENPFRAGCFAGERTAFQIAYTIDYHDSHMLEEDIQFEMKNASGNGG